MIEPAYRAVENVIVQDPNTGVSFVAVAKGQFLTVEQAESLGILPEPEGDLEPPQESTPAPPQERTTVKRTR
jgi:hypothetical protein